MWVVFCRLFFCQIIFAVDCENASNCTNNIEIDHFFISLEKHHDVSSARCVHFRICHHTISVSQTPHFDGKYRRRFSQLPSVFNSYLIVQISFSIKSTNSSRKCPRFDLINFFLLPSTFGND